MSDGESFEFDEVPELMQVFGAEVKAGTMRDDFSSVVVVWLHHSTGRTPIAMSPDLAEELADGLVVGARFVRGEDPPA